MRMPSKKVLSLLVLSIAAVFSIIIVFGEKQPPKVNLANTLLPGENLSLPENPNWQEDFDQISFYSSQTSQELSGEEPTDQTTTDAVATSLFSNYLVLKQNGLLNQSSAEKLVDQSLNIINDSSKNTLNQINLNIVPDNGTSSMKIYGEELGNLFRSNKPTQIKNEVDIINAIAGQKDVLKIQDLNSIISVYENIADSLGKMFVPKTFTKAHTQMINSITGITMALKEMRNILDDPIKSLAALQLYQESFNAFLIARQATNNFLLKKAVIYEQGSGGYYLMYGI